MCRDLLSFWGYWHSHHRICKQETISYCRIKNIRYDRQMYKECEDYDTKSVLQTLKFNFRLWIDQFCGVLVERLQSQYSFCCFSSCFSAIVESKISVTIVRCIQNVKTMTLNQFCKYWSLFYALNQSILWCTCWDIAIAIFVFVVVLVFCLDDFRVRRDWK